MVLASASTALADEEDKHPRLVKPEGDQEDNAQLGGEPSLTEVQEVEKKQHKKGTLELGKETGSIGKEVHDDPGDTLAAEPSTTSLSETKAKAPDEGKLPGRLGPVRIRVGKTDDWVGVGFGTPLQLE